MKKKDKTTAIQIVGSNKAIRKAVRPNPEKRLKELNLDTNPEWTIHYFFKPYMGGIMYEIVKKEDENGKNN